MASRGLASFNMKRYMGTSYVVRLVCEQDDYT